MKRTPFTHQGSEMGGPFPDAHVLERWRAIACGQHDVNMAANMEGDSMEADSMLKPASPEFWSAAQAAATLGRLE